MLKEFKTLKKFIFRYSPLYLAGIAALILTDLSQLLIPDLIRKAVNSVTAAESPLKYVLFIALAAVSIAAGRFIWRYFILGASRKITRDLRTELFSHMLKLDSSFYAETKTGDLMARATNDMNAVRMATGMGLVALFDGLVMTTATLTLLIVKYKTLALITIAPLPFITFFILLIGRSLTDKFRKVHQDFATMNEGVRETLSGIKVIKTMAKEEYAEKRFEKANDSYRESNWSLIRVWGTVFPIISFIAGFTTFLIIRTGGERIIDGKLQMGDIAALIAYLEMMIWPMISAGFVVNVIQRGKVSLKRINEIMNTEPAIKEPEEPVQAKASGHIKIADLSFCYGKTENCLKNLNTEIPAGSTLGIIGTTGSGKSTLIKLIPRLLDPPESTIFINEIDIRKYSLKNLRENISIVTQEPGLFSDTIFNNIKYAKDHPDSKIKLYSELSNISNDFNQLPEGGDTQVGEKGVTLSGGQKQRIAIARALAAETDITIFDDPFSALDAETEAAVFSRIKEYRQGRTNIIISNRTSSLKFADKIIVMDRGEIIEEGTHQQLINNGGLYSEINILQNNSNGHEEIAKKRKAEEENGEKFND